MKYLIVGGAGFIGSHLVDRLLKEPNADVVVLDDFSMGRYENLPSTKDAKNLIIIGASIFDDIDYIFEGVDVVFHFAALTRPRYSLEHPLEVNKTNVEGTLKMLVHARDNMVRKFVFISSAAIYGKQDIFPIREDSIPHPKGPYAVSKLAGEMYCKLFSELYGMKVNCVRPFNVYGKRQSIKGSYAAAIPNFINALKDGTKPYITGDGKQVRDFVYVEDVVELIDRVAKSDLDRQVFNAGSGESTSVQTIYDTISSLMDKVVVPDYIAPIIEPETKADVDKAKVFLGWTPKTSLEEGLRRTI
jgi:nucleoside-diphosphate-sugar epimerase